MPSQPQAAQLTDIDSTFFSGVKSDADPNVLPLGYAWSAVNTINIGGVISCRPGYRCLTSLPDGKLQGCFIFRPAAGLEEFLFVVDGLVYVSPYPFLKFTQVPNIKLSPYAKQVFWEQATQSVERIDSTFTSKIRTLEAPKQILFIQDGGLSAPAFYDGAESGQLSGDEWGLPSGSIMVSVGDRMWVSSDNVVFASDVANPFSFRENFYLGGSNGFFFSGTVTAMCKTPSVETPQLMVFTESDASILQANIRDRSQWATTPNFQEEILQVGCVSPRSVVSHYGQVVWFSPDGVSIFDPATSGKLTSRLPIRDNEMLVSKSNLSTDLTLIATASYGQFLLVSVPSEDNYNLHTWVLNHASLTTLSDDSGPSWCGYWLGTRPVEWAVGVVAGTNRIYHVSVDSDGVNRLWECFQKDKLDNGCPITWAVETRAHFGQTSAIDQKIPGSRCRLQWLDVSLCGMSEDIDVAAYYAGGVRGAYRQFLNRTVKISDGSLDANVELTADSVIYAFKPQSRIMRSQNANTMNELGDQDGCDVEREDNGSIDECFQFLLVFQGPGSLRFVRSYALVESDDLTGSGEACEDETTFRAVRFDGVGAKGDSYEDVLAVLDNAPIYDFESTQTVALSYRGYSAVGIGNFKGVISQNASDRVASIIATQMAEAELRRVIPPTVSIGEGIV